MYEQNQKFSKEMETKRSKNNHKTEKHSERKTFNRKKKILQGEEREKRAERLLKEIMTENF